MADGIGTTHCGSPGRPGASTKCAPLSTGTGTTQFEGSLVGLARAQDILCAISPHPKSGAEQIVLAQLQAEHKLMCTLSPQPSAPVAEQLFGHSCVRDTHSFDRYQAYHSALDNYRDTGRAPPGGRTKIVTLTVHSYHVDNGRPTIGAWWPFAGARSRGLCGLPPSYQTLLPASPIRCFDLSRTVTL